MATFIKRFILGVLGAVGLWMLADVATPIPSILEREANDLRALIDPPAPNAEVVVVALPRRWETTLLADVVDHLNSASANVIALTTPVDGGRDALGDARLVDAFRTARAPIILGRDGDPATVTPFERALSTLVEEEGHLQLTPPAASAALRDFPGVRTTDSASMSSLAIAAAGAAGAIGVEPTQLDYASGPSGMGEAFAAFPATAVFAAPAAAFRGRVVLIGEMDGARAFIAPDNSVMPPLSVHAHAVAQLLDGRDRPEGPLFAAVGLAIIAAVIGAIAIRIGGLWAPTLIVGAMGVIIVGGWFAYALQLWSAPIVWPIFALFLGGLSMGWRADGALRRRRRLRLHGRTNAAGARHVLKRLDRKDWIGAPTLCVSIAVTVPEMGAALSRARSRAAAETAQRHDAAIVDAAKRFGGYVSEFGGDRWVILFGWSDDPEYAGAAARCAAALPLIFADLAQTAADDGIDMPPPRIGVATGRAAPRAGLTDEDPPIVVGPAVETARRLASAADQLGVASLACATTVREAQACEEEPPAFRPIGDASIGGATIRIFTPSTSTNVDADYAEGFERPSRRTPRRPSSAPWPATRKMTHPPCSSAGFGAARAMRG